MTVTFAIRFLLAALALYRVAMMLTLDDGPFGVFDRMRLWLGKRAADRDSHGLRWTMAEISNCPHCVGVWLALLFAPMVIWPNKITDIIIIILALSGMQSLMTGRGET